MYSVSARKQNDTLSVGVNYSGQISGSVTNRMCGLTDVELLIDFTSDLVLSYECHSDVLCTLLLSTYGG